MLYPVNLLKNRKTLNKGGAGMSGSPELQSASLAPPGQRRPRPSPSHPCSHPQRGQQSRYCNSHPAVVIIRGRCSRVILSPSVVASCGLRRLALPCQPGVACEPNYAMSTAVTQEQ
ncbi:hypothetical protein BaRGS_00015216 [Batillaria attramentaria]|uniref:Uncharacterized protein n=1 Tax=Batillaria attramentaria TaxID=370345 RepID=A0ABD0L212_9CAEN